MTLEYTITKKDYDSFIYNEQRIKGAGKNSKIIGYIRGAAVFYMMLIITTVVSVRRAGMDDYTIIAPSLVILAALTLGSIILDKRVRAKAAARSRRRRERPMLRYYGSHSVEATADRLVIRRGELTGELFYGVIDHLRTYNGALAIYTNPTAYMIIPDRAFADAEARNSFISLLRGKMSAPSY